MKAVYLGLDVGDARIGIALSRSGVLSEPHTTVFRRGKRQMLDEIQRIVEANSATHCIVGLPLLESGSEGEQAEKTRAFVRSLKRRMPHLIYEFMDERYTSNDARELAGYRAGPGGEAGLIDRLAAALILQQYLDQKSSMEKSQRGGTS